MFAIFECGGKQYKVSVNDTIYVEKITGNPKDPVVFENVLMIDKEIGSPYIPKASIVAEVVKQGKQKKLAIIKHQPQKHHTKRYGHRQPYTKLIIKEIKHG